MKIRVITGVKQQMWDNERGLAFFLFLLLIVDFLLIPVFSDARLIRIILKLFWAIFLFTGINAISNKTRNALLLSVIPIIQILTGVLNIFYDQAIIDIINTICRIASFLLLIGLVLARVFQPGPVTVYRILGAVAVFILLANLYGEIYLIIYHNYTGAFNVPENGFRKENPFPTFLYFSFITITTTGYGEIVPVLPPARSVVQIEALTGVLYPTILISRLVSGSIESSKKS
jgi:hypothetical protein